VLEELIGESRGEVGKGRVVCGLEVCDCVIV
jgi:hypothetical protein